MRAALRRRGVLIAAALTTAQLAGCSGGPPPTSALPPHPATVSVAMRAMRFDHTPQASPGRAVFRVVNTDSMPHELTLVRLGPDQLGPVRDIVLSDQPLATVVILFARDPRAEDVFAVDLVPGRYGFICFTKDADGVQHVTKGMVSELLVA